MRGHSSKCFEHQGERQRRIKAEEANDKLKRLSSKQIEEIERLRGIIESKGAEARELDLERERRLKTEENNDRLKQLSNQQGCEIERLRKQLEDVVKQVGANQKTYLLEEQLDKQKQINAMQASELERLKFELQQKNSVDQSQLEVRQTFEVKLQEAIQQTEARVNKRHEVQKRGMEEELRDLKLQLQTLQGIVKGARDESAKLRLEIKDWEKREDIYESTVMGLKVQVNCLEQQKSTLSSQINSPARRSLQSQLLMNQSMSSVRPSQEVNTSYYRDYNLSSARAKSTMRSEESSQPQITPREGVQESARRFKIRVTELEDSRDSNFGLSEEERKKKLEAYSLNLLKSIEKRASTQGQGGIDSRFKHLATNPVVSSLSSRIFVTRSSHTSGSCTPQLGGRSQLSFFDKATPVRRQHQGSNNRTQSTNISIVNKSRLSEQKPKHSVKIEMARSLRTSQEGSLKDEGILTERSERVFERKAESSEANLLENVQSQGGEQVSMSYRSENPGGVSSGVRAALASLWVQSKESVQAQQSMISSQTGEFEVMRSKLQKISLTSKELEKHASETAEEIEHQERVFKEVGPPSVGDAAPAEHLETE